MALFPVLFWVLAFLWQAIPVMLASFQEQFDLGILLRFPLRFGSYVLLYLVFGLVDISTILGGLCCVGIWFGVAAARPGLLLWTTLALGMFAAFNILLVRAIFAWIDRWLAQRRTREILGAIFMVAILSLQLLNPALYQKRHSGRSGHMEQAEQFRAAKERYSPWAKKANAVQKWLPPGLAALSLREAIENEPLQGLGSLGVLGLYALLAGGVLALRLKAEYRGENLGSAPARNKSVSNRTKTAASVSFPGAVSLEQGLGEQGTGRILGGVAGGVAGGSGPIAAVMEKDIRSLLRTLPLLYAIGAPLLLVLVFSGIFIKNGGAQVSMFPLALPVCMVYAQLGFTQVFYNNLGTEGAGVQIYFLSPTPFRTVLLAKNLLHAMLFAVVAVSGIGRKSGTVRKRLAAGGCRSCRDFSHRGVAAVCIAMQSDSGQHLFAEDAVSRKSGPYCAAARLAGQCAAQPAGATVRSGCERGSLLADVVSEQAVAGYAHLSDSGRGCDVCMEARAGQCRWDRVRAQR